MLGHQLGGKLHVAPGVGQHALQVAQANPIAWLVRALGARIALVLCPCIDLCLEFILHDQLEGWLAVVGCCFEVRPSAFGGNNAGLCG